jgi:hypothetical protein
MLILFTLSNFILFRPGELSEGKSFLLRIIYADIVKTSIGYK